MPKVKKIYKGNVQVWPAWWQPWANTIAYYKFNWNLNDSSGNWFNLSMGSGSMTYWTTSWWATYWTFTWSNWTNTLTTTVNHWTTYTLSCWLNTLSNYWWSYQNIMVERFYANNIAIRLMNWRSKISCYDTNTTWPSISLNTWYNAVVIRNWSAVQLYLNWVYQNSWTWSVTASFPLRITLWSKDSPWATWAWQWQLSEVIIENKARTADEVSKYYNLTKWNYWTSGSQASSCFLAWTPVLIEWWSKPIDELNIWDAVLSYNKSTWEKEYNKVVDIIEHTETKDLLYTLDIEWQRIEATEFHKFYISDDKEDWKWEEIRNLKEWQFVFSIWWAKKINSVESKKFDWPCYNITVDNNHNYFVYDGILAHNSMSAS